MEKEKQGVTSQIEFPLGQDEMAISRAIGDLLSEGWSFLILTRTRLILTRMWEYDPSENKGMVETNQQNEKP
ncbi:MAG TPA: hypothetical protein ENH85_02905 [Candidatus Scalindua sp.]|nr:hypothetical protein [Candidatus Scalindua sp.]